MNSINTDFFRGRVDTILLSVLQDKDRYGYEILELIIKNSVSHYEIKQSTLYNSLKRLETNGLVLSYDGEETNGAKRKYYALTDKGKEYLSNEQIEWEYTRSLLDKLVSDKPVDLSSIAPPYNASDLRPLTLRSKPTDEMNKINPPEKEPCSDPAIFSEMSESINVVNIDSIAKRSNENIAVESKTNNIARNKATKLLGLGEYEPINVEPISISPNNNDSNKIASLASIGSSSFSTEISSKLDYREALGAVFEDNLNQANNSSNESFDDVEGSIKTEESSKSHHFNDMKKNMSDDGYIIRLYSKANSTEYYYMNYYFSRKLGRDSSLIVFAILFLELILLALFHKPNSNSYWILLICSLSIPLFAFFYWRQVPNKRIRTKLNLSKSLATTSAVFLFLAALNLILSILLKNEQKTFYLYLVFLNIPIFSIIYYGLYRSKKYHLKK